MTSSRMIDIIREALAVERSRAKRLTHVQETAFLPAALEVVERPVSPTARTTARLLLGGLLLLLGWLVFGRVDIVATAPGRIMPAGSVKLVQSAGGGIVRHILVRDGQAVLRGQTLVILDPTASAASLAQAHQAMETASLDVARARAVLGALDGRDFRFEAPDGTPPLVAHTHQRLARAQLAQVLSAFAMGRADRRAAGEAEAESRGQAAKLAETIPLLREQLDANEALLAKGFVSKLRVIEMRRQYLGAIRDRDIALRTAQRAGAQSISAGAGAEGNAAQARAQLLADFARAQSDMALRREELVKSRQRASFTRIVAPVDGSVSQLAIHTEGGVVQAGRPLMAIVPRSGTLVAEVRLLNRDVGFVAPGQPVTLKLEAFPFTRYGTVKGRVLTIGSDAVLDSRMGPIYVTRVSLDRQRINLGTRTATILPGMAVAADIRTGRRSFLSYLLSPIEAARLEAARER